MTTRSSCGVLQLRRGGVAIATPTDAAALAAALALNGASSGITAAQNAVANTKNAWNLDSAYITNYQVAFATGVGGPWDGNRLGDARQIGRQSDEAGIRHRHLQRSRAA